MISFEYFCQFSQCNIIPFAFDLIVGKYFCDVLFNRISNNEMMHECWTKIQNIKIIIKKKKHRFDYKYYFFCPILWIRPIAWSSSALLIIGSIKNTLEASVKFNPFDPEFNFINNAFMFSFAYKHIKIVLKNSLHSISQLLELRD